MKKLEVITIPNQKLRKVTKSVASFDNELTKQVESMHDSLRLEGGIGLAANQVGFDNQVLVAELDDEQIKEKIPFQCLINPKIVHYSNELESTHEGCLSVPLIELPVERSKSIKIKAVDLSGHTIKFAAKCLYARILQHEIDHLNGVVFTDKIRDKYLKDYPFLKNIKIIIIGTGDFCVPLLKGLILLGLNISLVITEKGKPSGRNKIVSKSPIAQICDCFGQKYLETENISDLTNQINNINPDIIILSDFGQKIPKNILDLPKKGAFNLHPSLLPKYKGATPIPNAILACEKETGVSLIKMSEIIDEGKILAQINTEVLAIDNSETLEKKLSVLALQLVYEVLPKLAGTGLLELKTSGKSSYTTKFEKKVGEINWTEPVELIERKIRAFFPWPGTFTLIDNKRLIIKKARLNKDKLLIEEVQPEGKDLMSWKDFLRGYHGPKPKWFEKIS